MSEQNVNITEYFLIYDKRQGSEYVSYNTWREVTLQTNEYLLRDGRIQNPVKGLTQSSFEKQFQLLIAFPKHSILNLREGSEYVVGFKYVSVLNFPELTTC